MIAYTIFFFLKATCVNIRALALLARSASHSQPICGDDMKKWHKVTPQPQYPSFLASNRARALASAFVRSASYPQLGTHASM